MLNAQKPLGYVLIDDLTNLNHGRPCLIYPCNGMESRDPTNFKNLTVVYAAVQCQEVFDFAQKVVAANENLKAELQSNYDAFTELAIRYEECKRELEKIGNKLPD